MQILDFPVFEGDGLFQGNLLSLKDAISWGQVVGFCFKGGDGTFKFIGDILDLFVLVSSFFIEIVSQGGVLTFQFIDNLLELLIEFFILHSFAF